MLAPRAVLAPRVARASRSSADGKQQPSSARTTTTFFQRARATRRRERALHVMRLYPDAGFVAKVQSKFPAQGVASAEEGRRVSLDHRPIESRARAAFVPAVVHVTHLSRMERSAPRVDRPTDRRVVHPIPSHPIPSRRADACGTTATTSSTSAPSPRSTTPGSAQTPQRPAPPRGRASRARVSFTPSVDTTLSSGRRCTRSRA